MSTIRPARPKPPRASAGQRVRGSGAQIVYDTLRKAILELELEPGSPLDEVRLSAQFDMSRTPIREAMVRLASEGLVTSLPNRNTIVTPIDFVRLPVYFEALSLMYRVSARLAALNHKAEDLIRMRAFEQAFADAVARQDALDMIASNRELHVAIAEGGGNPYFVTFFARLLDEGRRILRLYYSSFGDRLPHKYIDEHREIVDAIAAGDAERADVLSTEHAAQIVRQIQDYIARNGTGGLPL